MIKSEQFVKLIQRLQGLAASLTQIKGRAIHQQIDQFFYMQKIEEMNLLLEQLEEARMREEEVRRRMQLHYFEMYRSWRRDVRWLNQYHNKLECGKKVL